MAARKTPRKTPRAPLEPTPRHLWLAGLGLIAVARREAIAAVADATGRLHEVREQGEARVGRFSAEVETRLEPVLAKLGLKTPTRTPATRTRKKPAAKRPRAAPARKPAAKRARTRHA